MTASVVPLPLFYTPDEPWHSRAKCFIEQIDPNWFFPAPGESVKDQVAYCRDGCEVRHECLDYAIDNNIELGVWGGESGRQRRKIARRRRAGSYDYGEERP